MRPGASAVPATLHHFYNAVWYSVLPFALLRGGDRRERLGYVDPGEFPRNAGPRLWFHAASVGEVEGLTGIAQGLMRGVPHAGAVITTMTEAGRDAARRRIPDAAAYRLAPLDHPRAVRTFVSAARPNLVVIAETELWPNYFLEARRAGAKVAIVNGRVSEHSLRRYRWARPLFAGALSSTDLILAQTEADAHRYRALGAPRRRVVVTGNTKFDFACAPPAPLRPELERCLGTHNLLVAGSTAPGEERIILDAYRLLTTRFPSLGLIIAPRHLTRIREVEQLLRDGGVQYVKASTLPHDCAAKEAVLLLDTMGELRGLYYRAELAFVGGTLAPGRGGQSLAEPAAAAVPVLFGPFHESQRQLADPLVTSGGGRIVRGSNDLASVAAELLTDGRARRQVGMSARRSLELLGGGVAASLPLLKALIGS